MFNFHVHLIISQRKAEQSKIDLSTKRCVYSVFYPVIVRLFRPWRNHLLFFISFIAWNFPHRASIFLILWFIRMDMCVLYEFDNTFIPIEMESRNFGAGSFIVCARWLHHRRDEHCINMNMHSYWSRRRGVTCAIMMATVVTMAAKAAAASSKEWTGFTEKHYFYWLTFAACLLASTPRPAAAHYSIFG